jgi:hypothetical protein
LTRAESWVAVTSGVMILDSSDLTTLNDTGSWVGVVVTGAVVVGMAVTVVVVRMVVTDFVHPTALNIIIATNTDKNIFFILKPRLSAAFTNYYNV